MGLLLSQIQDLELPAELRESAVSEKEAQLSGPLRVLACPRCQRRLCALERASGAWRAPAARVERSFFREPCLRCRACGSRVAVEQEASEDARVLLRASGKAFRRFSAFVCGLYDSTVQQGVQLLKADAVARSRAPCVAQKTLRRSELGDPRGCSVPAIPLELVLILHRVSGQRNPVTDSQGLYSTLLSTAWQRCEAVVVVLLDVPCGGYFPQLLEEQPTLLGLLAVGRLLPLFTGTVEEPNQERPSTLPSTVEVPEAAWWLVRCLDGRIPRVDGGIQVLSQPAPPGTSSFNANNSQVRAAAAAAAAEGARTGSTLSILEPLVEVFEGCVLVRD